MKRFHARVAVVDALKEKGLYVETKDNAMSVPICRYVLSIDVTFPLEKEMSLRHNHSKSGDIIEPIMKPQWWVKSKPLADAAVEVSSSSSLKSDCDN